MKDSIKMSVPEIKKALKSYDPETLISIILDCYKMSKETKNYIHVLLKPEEAIAALYDESKQIIEEEFFPERGHAKLRLARAKKAISDFKKLSNDEILTIDLMIYYVEQGVDFTNAYGDISEPFYNSMVSMYANVLKMISGNELLFLKLKKRLERIVTNTSRIGWGFHDDLGYLYAELEGEFVETDD